MEEKLHNVYNKEYTEEDVIKLQEEIDALYNEERFKEHIVVATGKGGAINYLKLLHKQLDIIHDDKYYDELIKDGKYLITNKGLEKI